MGQPTVDVPSGLGGKTPDPQPPVCPPVVEPPEIVYPLPLPRTLAGQFQVRASILPTQLT
jgi:hypothetical protein